MEFTINQEKIALPDSVLDWDLIKISEHQYHIIFQNRSFLAEVEHIDWENKIFKLKINKKIVSVAVKDRMDLLLEKMGMSNTNAKKINELKAPMPGMILNIAVQEGNSVKKGDKLLILEAMKMENVLKSPTDAVIKSIKIKQGERVEKNHVLIVFQ